MDLGLTIVAAVLIALWRGWSIPLTIIGLLVIGEVVHYAFCVDTAVIRWMRRSGPVVGA